MPDFQRVAIAALVAVFLSFPLTARALEDGLPTPIAAPDITGLGGPWINSPALTAKDLKGKVVLIDFWTYSCINCLRTIPYIKAWYEHYKDQGLVVIGVHAPEFDFEKNKANVEKAVTRFKVTWPVVQDNDRAIWNAFHNEYWPAHYLINREGQIVYTHFGEGNYERTEKNIRELLGTQMPMAEMKDAPQLAAYHQTPETYLGTARGERFTSTGPDSLGAFDFPKTLDPDLWALKGQWARTAEYDEAKTPNAALRLHFRGGKVFLVMGSNRDKPIRARILFNDAPAGEFAGKDVKDGYVTINEQRLYEILDRKTNSQTDNSDGVIEIQAETPGLRVYAFTFGA